MQLVEGLKLEEMSAPKSGQSREFWLPDKKVEAHLAEGMLEHFHLKRPRSIVDFLVSVLGHSLVVALLLLLPLLYTRAINMPQFEKTLLVLPPPPPPPPAPMSSTRHIAKSFFTHAKLIAPKFIPKHIEQVKEEAPPALTAGGETDGVPGGVPGGQMGGVLGAILGGGRQVPEPLPPAPAGHKGPYRVGGQVRPPQLVERVQPIYPALAKQARIQGDVVIDSVIDTQGKVTKMKVVSGSPLLVEAALSALKQWKYQPTLLNGVPVSIDMFVTIHFELGDQGIPS